MCKVVKINFKLQGHNVLEYIFVTETFINSFLIQEIRKVVKKFTKNINKFKTYSEKTLKKKDQRKIKYQTKANKIKPNKPKLNKTKIKIKRFEINPKHQTT